MYGTACSFLLSLEKNIFALHPYRRIFTGAICHAKIRIIKDVKNLNKDEKYDYIKKNFILKSKKTQKFRVNDTLANIWVGMTLRDIADEMDKSLNDIYHIVQLNNTANVKIRLSPNTIIEDILFIRKLFKTANIKTLTIQNPHASPIKLPENFIFQPEPLPPHSKLLKRCPVVVIVGHVDHGKTTLLDCIRKSRIVDSEFGGITQHIGAFTVKLENASKDVITFIDTPGHAAFANMRSRGCHLTDLAILVVAADDGVMSQTVQSIKFAQESKIPIIVALNKIDKPNLDLEKVKYDLLSHGLLPEEFGGDIQVVPISALKGTNINGLLESVLAQAEMLDLRADYIGKVEGAIIESKLDKNRGILSTLLITRGTLKKGDILISLFNEKTQQEQSINNPSDDDLKPTIDLSPAYCKVRALFGENGQILKSVCPGYPVEVIGWKSLPMVGSRIYQIESEEKAKQIIRALERQESLEKMEEDWKVIEVQRSAHLEQYKKDLEMRRALKYKRLPRTLSQQQSHTHTSEKTFLDNQNNIVEKPHLPIVIKADVNGSLEAILDMVESFDETQNYCTLDILHYGIGPVTDFDVEIAKTFNGIIYAFNVDSNVSNTKTVTEEPSIKIKRHQIIYKLYDDLMSELITILPELDEEVIMGEARVKQEFIVTEGKNKIPVAGCMVETGTMNKKCNFAYLLRENHALSSESTPNKTLFKGKIGSLKSFKIDADEISKGNECGIILESLDNKRKDGKNQSTNAINDNTIHSASTSNNMNPMSIRYRPGDIIRCISIKKVKPKLVWDLGF